MGHPAVACLASNNFGSLRWTVEWRRGQSLYHFEGKNARHCRCHSRKTTTNRLPGAMAAEGVSFDQATVDKVDVAGFVSLMEDGFAFLYDNRRPDY